MGKLIRIGTRESQLAVWQATLVQELLAKNNYESELVFIKSEGDIDLSTPLYEIGVQGIFTRSLDIALLQNRIDIAVHSMKDVPTQLATGLAQAAVLERASYKDILVFKEKSAADLEELGYVNGQWTMGNNKGVSEDGENSPFTTHHSPFTVDHSTFTIATSSIRRKAQWLNRYPHHQVDNLRGNVNTRLRKVAESDWNGAIFAAAGLERIGLRPENSIDLDWMLPAPAQGAIMVVCRQDDAANKGACAGFNHAATATCTRIEKDFLRGLMGGCSTPVSALAEIVADKIRFRGSILSVDGKDKVEMEELISQEVAIDFGQTAATMILKNGGQKIADGIRDTK